MKKNNSRLLQLTALFMGFSIGPITVFGAGQFSATLNNPVRVVSDYFTEELSFSAAIGSRTYTQAMPGLVNTPRLLSADFETHSLEFNTDYFRNQTLVPVSVDADAYLNYRVKSMVGKRLGENVMRDVVEAQQSHQRQGLSVGINLPKRFDNVFGEGGANLKVSGFRRISFSGRSQWTGGADSGPFRQSKFPSLNMEQISRFDITGTIGTKISVSVSQDSQTDIPLSNRLQLRYKGDDDDILQSIEAGNTNLNLSNTRFVGYSSRIQGLFGIKAEAQLGNLHLTAIASQEKGSSERSSISATGEQSVNYIRDYQYAQGRIFDLPGERPEGMVGAGLWGKNDSVRQLYVYEHDIRDSLETDSAIIFVDSVDETSVTLRTVKVKQLRGNEDYWWVDDPQRNLHYVVFRSQRREGLAVNIEIARYDDDFNFLGSDTVGAQPDTGAFQLRFIRALTQDFNVNHPTWKLMWRNAYAIPRGTTVEDLKLKIFKGLQNREGTPGQQDFQNNSTTNSHYISILGLDQLNDGTGARIPDNRLDDDRDVFRPEWGLVIFPEREPFNSTRTFTDSLGGATSQLAVRLDNIYNFASPSEQTERSEYYLQISTAGARSNTIRLNRANILEGSERVTVNGRLLTRGVDYNIQYDFGQVTLLSEDATDPNAELNIDFEYAPFLAVQKKSLLGMRAEYEWSRDFSFGTTILFKSDKAQDRKPRVGQETSKALVADIDMSLRLRPNFITRMVNALPLVSTEVPSSMQITAEVAQSRPNPNVEGEAFVDDFESAIENVTLGLTRSSWKLASKPFGLDNSYERGRLLWHQIGRIPWEEVFNSESPVGQNGIIPLRIVFRPNNNFRFRDVGGQAERIVPTTPPANNWWAGFTRAFGNRLDAKRLQLFEMRVRAFGRRGVLHLDFGRISEDTDGNGEPDTEDTDLNRSITEEEDVGLDHLADFEEPGFDSDTLPDPSGDNWYHQGEGHCPLPASLCNNPAFVEQLELPNHPLFAEWLNGTDGNRQDVEFFQQPDEEKFSTAGHSKTNAYFSFKVDLGEINSPFEVDDSRNEFGWVTYRVPIRDTNLFFDPNRAENVSPDEPADWANVTHVRVWYEAPAGETRFDTLEIATWGFVQSNWQDSLVSPTFGNGTFFVASVTEDENAIFNASDIPYEPYISPIDNVTEPRRALSLIYENLQPDDTGFVTKDLVSTESYTGYRKLEMYVYAPQSAAGDSLAYFFRLGLNEENFYEFSTILQPLWHEGNWVNIDFNDITALKDSALRSLAKPNDPLDIVSGNYRIKGRPNLNEIKFFAAGVTNKGSGVVSGEIWMDELRLTDVRDDPGTAARVNVTGSLADLATYGFSIEHKDPFFRGLSSVTRGGGNNNLGSGRTDDRFSFNSTVNIDKFLPRSWKALVPISFTYNKSTLVPLVRTNSDIVLPESVRQAEKTTSVSRTFRISESFDKAGKNPLFTVLLNRQRMSLSYSRSERSSPTNPFSLSENYNVRSDYDMGIRSMPRIPIFFWTKSIPILKKTSESRLGLFPDTWRWSATFNRTLSITDDTQQKRVTSRRRDFDGRMNLTYRMFDNLTTSITYNTRRDLTDPDLVNLSPSDFRLGLETNYGQSVRADYAPPLLSFLTTSFNYSATYNDVLDRSSETRRSDLARTMGVSGRFDHIALLGGASRGAGRSGAVRSTGSGRSLRRTTEKRTPLYLKPVAGLRFLTKWINPLTYRYSETFNSSLPGMLLRPSLGYRIGLTRDTDVPIGSGDTRNPSSREGKSYEFSSGFTLFGGLTTDARYRQQDSQDLVRIGSRTKRSSTNWPDLTIRIRRLTYFPLIKNYINKFIDIFGPRTGYTRSVREDINLDGGFTTNRTESIDRNPLLAVNFRLLRSLSLSGSFSTSRSNVERFNQTNGSKLTESRSNRKTIAMSTKYSFSAPGGIALPIFGRIKFASTVSIDLNVRYNTNKTETARSSNEFIPTRDQTDLSVTPIISYTFSRQIRGGISGLWQDTNDRLNRVSHIRQLQIWTEIRF